MNKSENEFTAASVQTGEETTGHQRLKAAIRQAKSAQADRLDSITDMRAADIARLELLVQDLQPVFDAVPPQDEQWDFCLSHGMQPRLWLDASAFVMIARDRRNYLFVRDTRLGRVVLAENTDIVTISAAVTRYIALRIIERERLIDGIATESHQTELSQNQDKPADNIASVQTLKTPPQGGTLWSGLLWFTAGALLGCVFLVLMFDHYGINLPVLP